MKQYYKSDGRYKYHNRGLHYIVEFGWARIEERQQFAKLLKVFQEIYGPEKERIFDEVRGYPVWKMNDYWRSEQNSITKRRRIYLREESVLSLALLRVE